MLWGPYTGLLMQEIIIIVVKYSRQGVKCVICGSPKEEILKQSVYLFYIQMHLHLLL